MRTTPKSSPKPHDGNRALLVKKLAVEYMCTREFVRMAINGHAKSEKAEKIRRQYNGEYKMLIALTQPSSAK